MASVLHLSDADAPLFSSACVLLAADDVCLGCCCCVFVAIAAAAAAAAGNHLPNVTYVVSESFVVATKRVKHAIKSDIPSIHDHISKLVHIGKATVDKLQVC